MTRRRDTSVFMAWHALLMRVRGVSANMNLPQQEYEYAKECAAINHTFNAGKFVHRNGYFASFPAMAAAMPAKSSSSISPSSREMPPFANASRCPIKRNTFCNGMTATIFSESIGIILSLSS